MTTASIQDVQRRDIAKFCGDVAEEVMHARIKFPAPNCSMAALTEEVGELSKELIELWFLLRSGGRIESQHWYRVWDEAVQVAAVACRIAVEGDATLAEKPSVGGLLP